MKNKKIFYKDINFIRIVSCLAILLYHLGILKGGYLAVCTFFVMSGFLSSISAFKKEKFSLKSYYLNRLKKIYIPLVIVILCTVFVASVLPQVSWLNMKPESTSALLGYNNFWQLGANLDYFSRHIDSPFMHLWYVSILMQFELVFPILFLILKKIGDKLHKSIPCILTGMLAIGGCIYFYQSSLNSNTMFTYYSTFTRVFSLLFGLFLGFLHGYYKPPVFKPFKRKISNRIIFYVYMICLLALFVLIDASSSHFTLALIASTLITCRLIDYGTVFSTQKENKLFEKFGNVCYEIYLIQYPVIFFFQTLYPDNSWNIVLIILTTLILSYILNGSLNFKSKKRSKPFFYLTLLFTIYLSSIGGLYLYLAVDHTEEMKALEAKLAENEKKMAEKQKDYKDKFQKDEENWAAILDKLDLEEKEIENVVTSLHITGVGDSVLLGAVDALYKKFPNSYFDAEVSRSIWAAKEILAELKSNSLLGDTVVINLGANGDCSESCKKAIIEECENRKVFWINVTNDKDVHINEKLADLETQYDNLYIIDWAEESKDHKEYFYADGIHLNPTGQKAYTNVIYENIYKVYLEEYRAKKDQIIKDHDEEQKKKITFYGNELLINSYIQLEKKFPDAKYETDKDYTYDTLVSDIGKDLKKDSFGRLILVFDRTMELNKEQIEKIANKYKNLEVYLVAIEDEIKICSNENSKIIKIDFYKEIEKHPEYMMADRIHLSEEGNKELAKFLEKHLK